MRVDENVRVNLEKPSLERITPGFGSSLNVKQYSEKCLNKDPFWHFHPELELVYIEGGSGKRHIGTHMSYFNDGDLIFIGSNLPHFGFTDRLTGNRSETIIQMREDFLGESFLEVPEMQPIKNLFQKAKKGLVFHGITKDALGPRIERLTQLENYERLMELLNIFHELALSKEYTILNVDGYAIEIQTQDSDRMNIVFNHVRDNFKETITLPEISDKISMTVPAFCRYFKKMTDKTFTEFVNEYRLVHASKLLNETSHTISEVCLESGFNNFSHFNKVFKKYFGKSPSEFRKNSTKLIGDY